MNKLTDTLQADLTALAAQHGLTYDELFYTIGREYDKQNRLEDIRSHLESGCYENIIVNEHNIQLIYEALEKREDCEYGVWDNITNAIDWVYDNLEKTDEGDE